MEEWKQSFGAGGAPEEIFARAAGAAVVPMLMVEGRAAEAPVLAASAAFLEMSGYPAGEILGRSFFSLLSPDAEAAAVERLRGALSAGHRLSETLPFRTREGREIWCTVLSASPAGGEGPARHLLAFLDITERIEQERRLREAKELAERRAEARMKRLREANARLKEETERRQRTEAVLRDALAQGEEDLRFRDFLVREVNHRTKNALQLAIGLLAIQARQSHDETTRKALETAMARLRRIGAVHALLTYESENPRSIRAADYLRRLCHEVEESHATTPGQVRVEVDADEEAIWGPDTTVPLGLIVGEALTNAFKHAFPEGRQGHVVVRLAAQGEGRMVLRIEDDGVGLPAQRREGSLGLRLVELLARQAKGTAVIEAGPWGRGTVVAVSVPDPHRPPPGGGSGPK
ncbi:histidine kinase dimerization/phosphoacceptor domain -containing protein [Roseomonas sp. E05]|uniref:sensor histidine kinase n=1 Tax=Roseomonas sp. E05 TaxID=3046310 RepID=UPI0024BB1887|nr:histidine kinase dimerization/phosphoacceptor domain -containing protein [Roseomonas sp. E05]MDJ0387901.1 histidine kinase dimerization/phosphoacceptor domain -containing protein [Roseomonas sp. E05]